jgi:homoserine kinase
MATAKGKKNHASGQLPMELVLPATSANLGPAFDAAALAFNLVLKVRARTAPEFSITATGRDPEICGRVENHLILTTYREVLQAEGKQVPALALSLENQIPIGKGCGSSAAARLAGIALALHFGRLRWTDSRIVGEASRREHHPDNAAACWMGGLAVAKMSSDGEAQVATVIPKGKWPLLLAVPDEALSDRMHQPYRAALCPLLPSLQKLAGTSGILGAALSGAGPSVLIFMDGKSKDGKSVDGKAGADRTKGRVRAHLKAQGLKAELISTAITTLGAGQGKAWSQRRS